MSDDCRKQPDYGISFPPMRARTELDDMLDKVVQAVWKGINEMAHHLIEQASEDGYRGPIFVWWEMPDGPEAKTARVRGARALPSDVADDYHVHKFEVTEIVIELYRRTKAP
jgi:hypothetical protein